MWIRELTIWQIPWGRLSLTTHFRRFTIIRQGSRTCETLTRSTMKLFSMRRRTRTSSSQPSGKSLRISVTSNLKWTSTVSRRSKTSTTNWFRIRKVLWLNLWLLTILQVTSVTSLEKAKETTRDTNQCLLKWVSNRDQTEVEETTIKSTDSSKLSNSSLKNLWVSPKS